jgi:hypothetical protein
MILITFSVEYTFCRSHMCYRQHNDEMPATDQPTACSSPTRRGFWLQQSFRRAISGKLTNEGRHPHYKRCQLHCEPCPRAWRLSTFYNLGSTISSATPNVIPPEVFPVIGLRGPPHCLDNRLIDGGEIATLHAGRQPTTPSEDSGTNFRG